MTFSGAEGLTRAKGSALYLFPAIAVAIPLLFLTLTFEVVARRLIPLTPLEVGLLPPLLLVVGAVEYAVGSWLASERENGPGPLLRELLIVLIAGALIALALGGSLFFPLAALGTPAFWTIWIALFLQWLPTHSLRVRLRDHLLFRALFEGKEGPQAQALYRDWGAEAAETLVALARIRRQIVALLVMGLAEIILVTWPLHIALSSAEVAVSIAYLIVSLLALRSMASLAREQIALGEGAPYSPRQLATAASQAALLLAAACLASLLFAGGSSLLPATLIGRALSWLFGLFASHAPHGLSAPPVPHAFQPVLPPQTMRVLHGLGSARPPAWIALLGAILRTIGWGALFAVAVALLVFLVLPLFRRGSEQGRSRRAVARVFRYLTDLAQEVVVRLRLLIAGGFWSDERGAAGWLFRPGSGGRRIGRARRGRGGIAGRGRARGMGGEGKTQSRLAHALFHGAFRRLIRWGERMGVRFSATYAPLEYAGLLAQRLPETEQLLREVAAIYEEGVFSGRLPSDVRLAFYYRTIGRLTRMRGERG